MELKQILAILTLLLVIGCATEAPVVEKQIEETPTEEVIEEEVAEETTETVEETETTTGDLVLIKGPKAIEPSELTVGVGSTVTWKNEDWLDKDAGTGRAHIIAEWNNYFRSERVQPGETFSFTFEEAGTYEYRSITTPGARGTIIVE